MTTNSSNRSPSRHYTKEEQPRCGGSSPLGGHLLVKGERSQDGNAEGFLLDLSECPPHTLKPREPHRRLQKPSQGPARGSAIPSIPTFGHKISPLSWISRRFSENSQSCTAAQCSAFHRPPLHKHTCPQISPHEEPRPPLPSPGSGLCPTPSITGMTHPGPIRGCCTRA